MKEYDVFIHASRRVWLFATEHSIQSSVARVLEVGESFTRVSPKA